MYWTILIVCVIYTIIMAPIARVLKQRINSRWKEFLAYFVISMLIFIVLYAIADILGYGIWD